PRAVARDRERARDSGDAGRSLDSKQRLWSTELRLGPAKIGRDRPDAVVVSEINDFPAVTPPHRICAVGGNLFAKAGSREWLPEYCAAGQAILKRRRGDEHDPPAIWGKTRVTHNLAGSDDLCGYLFDVRTVDAHAHDRRGSTSAGCIDDMFPVTRDILQQDRRADLSDRPDVAGPIDLAYDQLLVLQPNQALSIRRPQSPGRAKIAPAGLTGFYKRRR